MQTIEQSLKTSELLNPVRGANESFDDYKKRRKNINKVVAIHIRGQAMPEASLSHPMHVHHYKRS